MGRRSRSAQHITVIALVEDDPPPASMPRLITVLPQLDGLYERWRYVHEKLNFESDVSIPLWQLIHLAKGMRQSIVAFHGAFSHLF